MKRTRAVRRRIAGGVVAAMLVSTAVLAANPALRPVPVAANLSGLDWNAAGFLALPPGARPVNRTFPTQFHGARPSYAVRRHGLQQDIIAYNTPIQHLVVILMENRTPENLFGAFWNTTNRATHRTFGQDLDLADPAGPPRLRAFPLEAAFDPIHTHVPGFTNDAQNNWSLNKPDCPPQGSCPPHATDLAYVPTPAPRSNAAPEVANYISLIENWAYANHVMQSNEGPSFPAHQYAISGQSGGIVGSSIAPNGLAENPIPSPKPPAPPIPDDIAIGGGSCATGMSNVVKTTNMTRPYPGDEDSKGQPTPYPCNDYQTIFDLMLKYPANQPAYDVWQYIAEDADIIWSGPMAVSHLYASYERASKSGNTSRQPFAADPDAQNFVANLTNRNPNPVRPFAALTYITPCVEQSDHPNFNGKSNGPQWLAWVVNAIGNSPYWNNTAIIVTWDDWGGFYDNYRSSPWPYHPAGNFYNNPLDPNEWGFRVPFLFISPYVTRRGYVSPTVRSQGAILNFAEQLFLPPGATLDGDDNANANSTIDDMVDFAQLPLPYVTLPTTFRPTPHSKGCPV